MNIRARTTALFMLSIALTTSAAHAGGFAQPNSTGSSPSSQAVSASVAGGMVAGLPPAVIAAIFSLPAGGSTTVQINRITAIVSKDASGSIFINGQPILVGGLPNLELLMTLGYGG